MGIIKVGSIQFAVNICEFMAKTKDKLIRLTFQTFGIWNFKIGIYINCIRVFVYSWQKKSVYSILLTVPLTIGRSNL
jgi:hypothetical protein